MIGREQPQHARQTDLKRAIAIGLDECTTALEEALHGLNDEQLWSRPLAGRHSIGTLAMHCLHNLDTYGLSAQTGRSLIEGAAWFDVWNRSPEELAALQQSVPGVEEFRGKLQTVRSAITEGLEAATEDDLRRSREGVQWFLDFPDRTRADAYMRTIMHTMAHTRQMWMLRGALGLTDSEGWPLQHWA